MALSIAGFSYGFLNTTSYSMAEKIITKGYYEEGIDADIIEWIDGTCLVAAGVVFFAIFIFLIGEKFSYILEVNKAIQKLEGGDLKYRIQVNGEDEIAELAESINHLAQSLESHIQTEEKLRNEREELIRSLSHDIRTPLTAIISYTDFIKNDKYDSIEKLNSYIETIQGKAYQIKELTEMLLSDPNSTETSKQVEYCDGKMLFDQLLQEYQEILEDEGFNTVIHCQELKSFKTKIQPQDIVRIFDNMVSNIIKYANPGHEVNIEINLSQTTLFILQTNRKKIHNKNLVESYGIGLKNIEQLVKIYQGKVKISESEKQFKIEIQMEI